MPGKVRVIALIPPDVDAFARAMGASETLKPTEGYTKTPCDECKVECWIGPSQLEYYQKTPGPIALMCYVCLAVTGRFVGMIDLGNPNAARREPL